MKTTIIRLAALALAGLTFVPGVALAVTVSSTSTAGDAAFTAPTTTVTPPTLPVNTGLPITATPATGITTVSPTSPATPPSTPGAGTATGNTGPLSLDYAPNFDFGTHAAGTTAGLFYATAQPYTPAASGISPVAGPNFAQVTDLRGTNAGWTLSVTQTADFKNNSVVLTGAQVALNSEIATNSSGNGIASVTNPTTLTVNTPTLVFSAKANGTNNEGAGTNVVSFGSGYADNNSPVGYFGDIKVDITDTNNPNRIVNQKVQLSVPASTMSSVVTTANTAYTTTFTWNLQEGPSSGPNDTSGNIL